MLTLFLVACVHGKPNAAASVVGGPPSAPAVAKYTTNTDGLQVADLYVGTGTSPVAGDVVILQYTGWLADGTVFDSSWKQGGPLAFQLGGRQVVPGFEEGVATMHTGGVRQVIVPATLGYGDKGAGDVIPANATLTFQLQLVEVRGHTSAPATVTTWQTTAKGEKYADLLVGHGPSPVQDDGVFLDISCWDASGTMIESTDGGEPLTAGVGTRELIAGLEDPLLTMKVGGRRQAIITPDLAEGAQTAVAATMTCELVLLGVAPQAVKKAAALPAAPGH